MFLAAIVGAVAGGFGIATYFTQHTYTPRRISSRTPGSDAPIFWFAEQ